MDDNDQLNDTEILTQNISDMSRINLRTIADQLFKELPDPLQITKPEEQQQDYLTQRSIYKRAITVRTLCQHPDLDDAYKRLHSLQKSYLKANQAKLEPMAQELEDEKNEFIKEVEKLVPKADRYISLEEELGETLRKKGQPRPSIYKELADLSKDLEKKEEFDKYVEKIEMSQANLSQIASHLTSLINAKHLGSIHYKLEPLSVYVEELKKGEYIGPEFDPIKVCEHQSIDDTVSREGVALQAPKYSSKAASFSDLKAIGLPPLLEECLKLKKWCDSLPPNGGNRYKGKDILKQSGADIGRVLVGGLLERGLEYFGMDCEKKIGRTFMKKKGHMPVHETEFLHAMLDKDMIGNNELANANRFYCGILAEIAKRNDKAEEGMDHDYLYHLAHSKGFPIKRRTISTNFNEKNATAFGLEYKDNLLYVKSVEPSAEERDYAMGALPELGFGIVGPKDLSAYIKDNRNFDLSPIVAEILFKEHFAEYNYNRIKDQPGQYQRIDRPEEVSETLKRTPEEPTNLI